MVKPRQIPSLSVKKLETIDKQKQALELRLAGRTWQEIADALGYASTGGAVAAVKTVLSRSDADYGDSFRTLTLERLTKILQTYWPAMLRGDQSSATVCLKTIKDMRDVTGIDMPARVEHSGPEGNPIQHQVVTLDVGDIEDALATLRDAGAIRVEANGHSEIALDALYPAQADS